MVLSLSTETVNIFFSLAHEPRDRNLFERLRKHLSALRRQGLIELWYDSKIIAGNNFSSSIQSYISAADIIVLLISADFWDSDQCSEVELPYALAQYDERAAHIIPLLLRPVDWSGHKLEQYSPLPPNGKFVSEWRSVDKALTEVAKGIRQIVDKLAQQWTHTPKSVKPVKFPLFKLPHRQSPFFTDRDTTLTELHSFFTAEKAQRTRTQALYGTVGIGKTLLAVEYAYRYQKEYQAVLWLNATSHELLSSDLRSLTDELGIALHKNAGESERMKAIQDWLQDHDRWLLVIDNLDDFPVLNQIIPLDSSGHVLLTTHSQATGPFASGISVGQMTVDEGALLLLRRAKLIPGQGTSKDASEADYQQAKAIAQEFESYPLALDQAGAYIDETNKSLTSYLELYHKQRAALLSRRGRFVNDHPDPVTTTLSLTFAKIARANSQALELLRLFAFLHPEAIPNEMITNGVPALTGPLRALALDPLALDAAIGTLLQFSLVHHSADSTILNIHHILQTVLKQGMTKRQQIQLANQAVRLIHAIFPEVRFATWKVCERYVPQAQRCAALIHEFNLTLKEGALLLERLGFYYYQRGSYSEAEKVLTQALHLQERQRRPDALDTAQSLNSLGLLAQRQARYPEAETFHRRALEIREHEAGPDDPRTAESLHNLAVLYEEHGQYQLAEQFYLRVLIIDERTAGVDHPDIAATLNNLGLIYYLQDRPSQAETMYQRALTLYEHIDHPDITYTLTGLGTLYESQGNYPQAEALYQRALSIREQARGTKHSETAQSINKLAHIRELQGDYSQAEALYQKALSILEEALGSKHPDVALLLNNLALLAAKREGGEK